MVEAWCYDCMDDIDGLLPFPSCLWLKTGAFDVNAWEMSKLCLCLYRKGQEMRVGRQRTVPE